MSNVSHSKDNFCSQAFLRLLLVYNFSPISCGNLYLHSSQKQLQNSGWGIDQHLTTVGFMCFAPSCRETC